jgi:two-component system chemotaxis sensor kinase CheA
LAPSKASSVRTPAGPVPLPEVRLPGFAQSLRVPAEKLDGLTNLAPEMVLQSLKASERAVELRRLEITLSRLRDRVREARLAPEPSREGYRVQLTEYADALDVIDRRLREFLASFGDDRVRLNLITEELRQNVIELTMLPLSTVFDAFPRAVRDLARTFDKEVDLTIRGRETELDKKIIEQIAEPLVHMIRNAIDHGIETPAERAAAGKPAAGQLLISAEQLGNRILVAVREDGRGIDPVALRAAGVRHGIASEADLDRWTPQQVLELIFQPGLSTRRATTDISGRGVGMDVVKIVVSRLGGKVRVLSEPGRGTTVIMDLPLSLALQRVVLVEAGEALFAVPTAAVRHLLRLAVSEIPHLQEGPIIDVGGETVPLAGLSGLLGIPTTAGTHVTVLVVEGVGGRFGLMVDAVYEEQELVFKELRGPFRDQQTFAGAALLGNGDIVPILDVQALFEMAARSPSVRTASVAERRGAARPTRVLVVEDSLVSGELQKNILLAAGYEAEIAQDGAEALELLRRSEWDLVITDVDMPHVDGFELTTRVRGDEQLRELPIIIVTSRDSIEDRRRGFEIGADAYVVKREFDQGQLLDAVRRLIGRGTSVRRPTRPERNAHA